MSLHILKQQNHYWRDDAPDYLWEENDEEAEDRFNREQSELERADFLYDERIERGLCK